MWHFNRTREQRVSIVTIPVRHFYDALFGVGPVNVSAQPVDSHTLGSSHWYPEVLDLLFNGSSHPRA